MTDRHQTDRRNHSLVAVDRRDYPQLIPCILEMREIQAQVLLHTKRCEFAQFGDIPAFIGGFEDSADQPAR